MKSRSVKLREAHKVGRAAFCCILWDHKAEHFVTSSSSDGSISVHDALTLSPTVLKNHQNVVTALALTHDSSFLASGSIDHCVKIFKFPTGEFHTKLTGFKHPIRALALDTSSSLFAVAGDDKEITLIDALARSIKRVLKGHKAAVTCLEFDPNGELLASLDSTGTVLCWELFNRTVLYTLERVAPNIGVVNTLRWSPDGRTLAGPGFRNDVVMYDRFTGKKLFALKGGHVKPVCHLTWSPNGMYIATSGLDKQVILWDVRKKQDINRRKFEERISCIAWKPNSNALSVVDVTGKYRIWGFVVPSSMVPFDVSGASESSSDAPVDSDDDEESHQPSRKRLRKQTIIDDEEFDHGSSLPSASASRKKPHKEKQGVPSKLSKSVAASSKYKMQSPFQPGATPPEPGKRTFLCYNMLGSITTIQHDGNSRIETDFHDTGRGPRVSDTSGLAQRPPIKHTYSREGKAHKA